MLRSGLGPNRFILIRKFLLRRSESGVTKKFWFPMWIKICFYSRERIILVLILINFDLLSKRTKRNDSFWFGLILILHESRFNRESWFTCESKSKVGESWFTYCRIIGCFDFESKANQSESRIKLVLALVFTHFCFFSWAKKVSIKIVFVSKNWRSIINKDLTFNFKILSFLLRLDLRW